MNIEIAENPQLTGEHVAGVTAGRIVAFWPTKEQLTKGLRTAGQGFIPAFIVNAWGQPGVPNPTPLCNIRLEVDEMNQADDLDKVFGGQIKGRTLGSVRYSEVPAYGCWTWIPKA